MTEINSFRFTGSPEDLDQWLWFFKQLEDKSLIDIIEVSSPYQNRNSKLVRCYIQVKLNATKP